jgi:hypothetical protein
MKVSREVRETWKKLYRLAKWRPSLGRRAGALASNLILLEQRPHDLAFRAIITEQAADLDRAIRGE